MATDFPLGLAPQSVLFDLENASRSGGVSTTGLERIIGSGASRWRATYSNIPVNTADEVLAYRAFKIGLRGRAGTFLASPFDRNTVNWPVDEFGRLLNPAFTRDRRLDGSIYQDPEIPAASQVVATFAASALRRATTVQIAVSQGSSIKAGQYFSPSAGRLHVITEVVTLGTYAIMPPLRDAATIGQSVNFTRPTCEMRLATDDSGALDLQLARFGSVTIDMIEAV
jgi:hypothetical protein